MWILARTQDEKRTRAVAADRQDLRLIRIERPNHFPVVRQRRNQLLIDLFDYIAFLQIGHARVRIDTSNYYSTHAIRQIELTGNFRS